MLLLDKERMHMENQSLIDCLNEISFKLKILKLTKKTILPGELKAIFEETARDKNEIIKKKLTDALDTILGNKKEDSVSHDTVRLTLDEMRKIYNDSQKGESPVKTIIPSSSGDKAA